MPSSIGPKQEPLLPDGSPKVERKTPSPTSVAGRATEAASKAWKTLTGPRHKPAIQYTSMEDPTLPSAKKTGEVVVGSRVGEIPTEQHPALGKRKTEPRQERSAADGTTAKPWRPDRSNYGKINAPGVRLPLLNHEAPSAERTRRLQNEQIQGYVERSSTKLPKG